MPNNSRLHLDALARQAFRLCQLALPPKHVAQVAHGFRHLRSFRTADLPAYFQRPAVHGLGIRQVADFPINLAQRVAQLRLHFRLPAKVRADSLRRVVQNLL